jgi:lipopolysaccharide assembly protein A
MRVVWIVAALLFAAVGAVFGALNGDSVALDFYFFDASLPKAAALLAALLAGWLIGGLVLWLAVVMPLRRRLSRQRRELARRDETSANSVRTTE